MYFFKDEKDSILYIGKAKSLRARVSSYFKNKDLPPKTAALVSLVKKIDHIEVESEIDALLLEANLVRKFQPKYNIELKDGKNYPLIEITIKEKIPQVKIARFERDKDAIYFGPFPMGSDVTRILRYLRKIFPFVSQNHYKDQVCFRSHLNLCPCATIKTKEGLAEYKNNLKRLIAFLSGQRIDLQKKIEKEMTEASKNEDYQTAQHLKEILEKLILIAAPRTRAFEYETNPVLLDEKRELELASLREMLGIDSPLHRIECYDISNTQGTLATAALIVWTNGAKDSGQYRKFKIKLPKITSDFDMMAHVFQRRFKPGKHEWPNPDLIVVDGGAGQLGAVRKVLVEYGLSIPTIGLAKKMEEIYLSPTIKFDPPENTPGLHLLQKMRDEAHRFSRKYHFHLRTKHMLS